MFNFKDVAKSGASLVGNAFTKVTGIEIESFDKKEAAANGKSAAAAVLYGIASTVSKIQDTINKVLNSKVLGKIIDNAHKVKDFTSEKGSKILNKASKLYKKGTNKLRTSAINSLNFIGIKAKPTGITSPPEEEQTNEEEQPNKEEQTNKIKTKKKHGLLVRTLHNLGKISKSGAGLTDKTVKKSTKIGIKTVIPAIGGLAKRLIFGKSNKKNITNNDASDTKPNIKNTIRNKYIKASKDRTNITTEANLIRMKKRKDEVEAEKKHKEINKKESNGILSMLSGLITPLISKIGPLIASIGTIGSMIFGGMSKAFKYIFSKLGFIKNIGPKILDTTKKIGSKTLTKIKPNGGLTKGLFKLGKISGVGSKTTSAAVKIGGKLAGKAAIKAGLMTAGMFIPGPGWLISGAMLALTAYEAYSAYKEFNKNNADDLMKLRFLQYGLGPNEEDYYYIPYALEKEFKPYITYDATKGYIFTSINEDLAIKIDDIFNINTKMPDVALRRETVLNWLTKRFLVVYINYLNAYRAVTDRGDLDKLSTTDDSIKSKVLTLLKIPSSIYVINKIYLNEIKTITVTANDINVAKINILNSLKVKKINTKKAAINTNDKQTKIDKDLADKKANEKNTVQSNTNDADGITPIKKGINIFKNGAEGQKKLEEINTNTGDTNNNTNINKSAINLATGDFATPSTKYDGMSFTSRSDPSSIDNLNNNVNQLFSSMTAEYKQLTGNNIQINEGFRTKEQQTYLHNKNPLGAAKPGNSTHEFGLAIDIPSVDANKLDEFGLLRKYGFTRPIGQEPWHLEPSGVSMDPFGSKSDADLRNKYISNSIGRGGGGYGLQPHAKRSGRNIALQIEQFKTNIITKVNPKVLAKNYNKDNSVKGNIPEIKGNIKVAKVPQPIATNSKNIEVANMEVTPPSSNNSLIKSAYQTSNPINTDKSAININYNKDNSVKGNIPEIKGNIKVAKVPQPIATNSKNIEVANMEVTPPSSNNSLIKSAYQTSNPINTDKSAININYNKATDIGQYTKLSPNDAIAAAAKLTNVNKETLLEFSKLESSGNANAKASTSNATGLFQFVPATWKEVLSKYGSKYNIPLNADPTNAFYNSVMAAEYLKANMNSINKQYKSVGLSDAAAGYLAHHYGVSGANKLIAAALNNSDTPIKSSMSTSAYSSNKAEFRGINNVGEYLSNINFKVNRSNDNGVSYAEYKPQIKEQQLNTEYPLKVTTNQSSLNNNNLNNTVSSITVDVKTLENISNKQLNILVEIRDILMNVSGKSQTNKTPIVNNAIGPRTIPINKVDIKRGQWA